MEASIKKIMKEKVDVTNISFHDLKAINELTHEDLVHVDFAISEGSMSFL